MRSTTMDITAERLVQDHHQIVDRAIRRLDPAPRGRRAWSRLTAAGRSELERAARDFPSSADEPFESFALERVEEAVDRAASPSNRMRSMIDHPSFR